MTDCAPAGIADSASAGGVEYPGGRVPVFWKMRGPPVELDANENVRLTRTVILQAQGGSVTESVFADA